jgi:hypothetical protein
VREHAEKPHSLDKHINEPMGGAGENVPPTIPPAGKEGDMPNKDVKEIAAANTTASARKQYNKANPANRALKAAVNKPARGRKVVVSAPVVAGGRKSAAPTDAELKAGGYEQPQGVDHSSGALDTPPPEAMPEVRRVAERKARGLAPEPEVGKRGKGKRKTSRKRK